MINAIREKYCKDNLVQLKCSSEVDQLIISPEEILFLRKDGKILINKYESHSKRDNFLDSESISNNNGECKEFYQLFEYDKVYLDFKKVRGNFELYKKYLFRGNNRALYLEEKLDTIERLIPLGQRTEKVLSRQEVEEVLNPNNYDSIYVMDVHGDIIFANNKKDGLIIGERLVLSDEEIVNLELERTKIARNVACSFNFAFLGENYTSPKLRAKLIENINHFDIYAPINPSKFFNHILITSKDGEFKVQHFNLKLLKKNSFRLITNEIFCLKPTVDDVINYTSVSRNEINYLDDRYDIPQIPWDSRFIERQQVLSDDDYIIKAGEMPWETYRRVRKK